MQTKGIEEKCIHFLSEKCEDKMLLGAPSHSCRYYNESMRNSMDWGLVQMATVVGSCEYGKYSSNSINDSKSLAKRTD
jgi:hypothetical protein